MWGGLRLICFFAFCLLLGAVVYGADDLKSSSKSPAGPPVAAVKPLAETLHGTKIIDNYRWLVDANALAADGTIALDWYEPAEHGKYLAYGTSPSGSEMSTLHIVESKTGNLLTDTIERTRAASIAWKHDNSGFYYTRYPKKGDVAEGQEVDSRQVCSRALGSGPPEDRLIFGEARQARE